MRSRWHNLFPGIFCCFLQFFSSLSFAQSSDPYIVEQLGLANGLPSRQIWGITQDKLGMMWFASADRGLFRYDGQSFTIFSTDVKSKVRISSNRIFSIACDPYGRIWLGHELGIDILDPFSLQAQLNIKLNGFNQQTGTVTSIFCDDAGNMWACAPNRGLIKFAGSDARNQEVFLPNLDIYYINKDINQQIRCITRYAMYHLDDGSFKITAFPDNVKIAKVIWPLEDNLGQMCGIYIHHSPAKEFLFFNISSAGTLQNGQPGSAITWASFPNFLERFHEKAAPFSRFPGGSRSSFRIFRDSNGLTWVATRDYGIFKIKARTINFITCPDLEGISLRGMAEMPDGSIYIGSYKGLFRYDPAQNKAHHIPQSIDLIFNILPLDDGRLICFTEGGSIWFYDIRRNQWSLLKNLNNITEDKYFLSGIKLDKNRVLAGNKQLFYINTSTGQVENAAKILTPYPKLSTFCFEKGPEGSIMIGTNNGLFLMHQNGVCEAPFQRLEYRLGSQSQINDIYIDNKGIYWYATKYHGLVRYDPYSKDYRYFDTVNGLATNEIYAIVGHNEDQAICISTASGIHYLPQTGEGAISIFNELDGTSSSEFNTGSFLKSRTGEIYFGSINGLTRFSLPYNQNSAGLKHACQTYIYSVMAESAGSAQTVAFHYPSYDTSFHLPYFHNTLEFSFGCNDYFRSDQIAYYVQLEGFDNKWEPIGNNHHIRYHKLPPGQYIFRVKCNKETDTTPEHSMVINIAEPFYRRSWFPFLVAGIISAFFWFLFRIRLRQIQSENELRRRIAADLHDELGSNISGISNLAHVIMRRQQTQQSVEKEVNYLVSLTHDTHSTVSDIIWAIDRRTKSDSDLITRMQDYADKWLKSAGIKVRFETNRQKHRLPLPFYAKHQILLAYKEILSNILKHTYSDLVCIQVDISSNRDIFIQVQNFFHERKPDAPSSGKGLANIETRVRKLKGEVKFLEEPGSFTVLINIDSCCK